MPATNSIKTYAADAFYHLYNRGVEKRDIFIDSQDFSVFLAYLKSYLSPKDIPALQAVLSSSESSAQEKDKATRLLRLNNFSGEMELHAFALLPNHFHLLVRQTTEDTIDRFLNSLGTRYTKYFNSKYHRVGRLYQGVYKAVMINSDEQLLHLSRYIHLNAFKYADTPFRRFLEFQENPYPSSLEAYVGLQKIDWLTTDQILGYFNRVIPRPSYRNFIAEYADPEFITSVAIDYTDET